MTAPHRRPLIIKHRFCYLALNIVIRTAENFIIKNSGRVLSDTML